MKYGLLIAIALLPAAVSANTLLCGSAANNLTALGCVSTSSFSFTDSLLWTTAGAAYESPAGMPVGSTPQTNPALATSWTGTSALGLTVTASMTSDGYLGRADEAPWVFDGARLGWNPSGTNGVPNLMSFQGPFYFSTSMAAIANSGTRDWGTALLETVNSTGPIVLTFAQSLQSFGVDVSSLGNVKDFTATLVAYDSQNHVIGTYVMDTNGTAVGGICQSLNINPRNGGVGCNDAPFLGIANVGNIKWVSISVTADGTNSLTPFAIDGLMLNYIQLATPEPETVLFAACGLAAILLWKKRSRKKSGAGAAAE